MRPKFFLLLLLILTIHPLCARADLNIFLGDLNTQAAVSPLDYSTHLGSQFGMPQSQVTSLMRSVAAPADAFMVLQLAQMLGIPHDRVLHTYTNNRGKGWGAIAKDLGIKPGSAQFHALKEGRFTFTGMPGPPPHGIKPRPGGPRPDYHGPDQNGPGKKHDQKGPGKKHDQSSFDKKHDQKGSGKDKGKGHNK